jgi:hypothetical protein
MLKDLMEEQRGILLKIFFFVYKYCTKVMSPE